MSGAAARTWALAVAATLAVAEAPGDLWGRLLVAGLAFLTGGRVVAHMIGKQEHI